MDGQCAILVRERAGCDWKFCTYAGRMKVAEASAQQIVDQEHLLGRMGFRARVMRRSDYDAKRRNAKSKIFR